MLREFPLMTFFQNRLQIIHGGTIASMVDLGGSLAVASRGLFATGVSTDLNGEFDSTACRWHVLTVCESNVSELRW